MTTLLHIAPGADRAGVVDPYAVDPVLRRSLDAETISRRRDILARIEHLNRCETLGAGAPPPGGPRATAAWAVGLAAGLVGLPYASLDGRTRGWGLGAVKGLACLWVRSRHPAVTPDAMAAELRRTPKYIASMVYDAVGTAWGQPGEPAALRDAAAAVTDLEYLLGLLDERASGGDARADLGEVTAVWRSLVDRVERRRVGRAGS